MPIKLYLEALKWKFLISSICANGFCLWFAAVIRVNTLFVGHGDRQLGTSGKQGSKGKFDSINDTV